MVYIFDVIHGHMEFKDEIKYIDNRWMKRLKRIKQLGMLDHIFRPHVTIGSNIVWE